MNGLKEPMSTRKLGFKTVDKVYCQSLDVKKETVTCNNAWSVSLLPWMVRRKACCLVHEGLKGSSATYSKVPKEKNLDRIIRTM